MKFWPFLLRELRKHHRFALLFVLVLGIGLSGFLLVEALRASVARSLEANARSILAADLSVSLRRPLTIPEEEKLRQLFGGRASVGSSRVDLQACKLEYSIVSPK